LEAFDATPVIDVKPVFKQVQNLDLQS
jgi:tRNA (Thr-GGU) A37 N-methylase